MKFLILVAILSIQTGSAASNPTEKDESVPHNEVQEQAGISSYFYDAITKSLQAVNWLFSNEKFTEFDKSDSHDVQLSRYEDPVSQQETGGWSGYFSHAARLGRQLFSATNAMTLGYETFLQTMSCLATSEFTDPDLGTFTLDPGKYCDPKCGRFIPGVLCCAPMPPELIDVKLRLKVRGQPERVLNFRDPADRKYLTAPGRVVFIIHGWIEKMSALRWITDMRDGFVDLDENAIVVDWRRGNSVHYWQAIANTRVVAAIIGKAIMNWGIADKTLVVGFSLGAQVAGEAGRYTQRHGVLINECHGLDPAGPFYDGATTDIVLKKSDCRVVQAIHTSAEDVKELSLFAVRFGTYRKSGHCDYWVNCGFNQGPCVDIDFKDMVKASARLALMSDGEMINYIATRACSHWRAPEIYNSALRGKCDEIRNPIFSSPCPDCGTTHYCLRESPEQGNNNTFPPFSKCSPDMDVNYYVSSSSFHPFCPKDRSKIGWYLPSGL